MDTITSWLTSVRDWLDARGRPAWLAAMILGFIFFWPIGLFTLGYMIWSNRMGCKKRNRNMGFQRMNSSGNAAFDAYRDETLKRLQEEQSAFQGFLQRLRDAKDKVEFDQFMDEQRAPKTTPRATNVPELS